MFAGCVPRGRCRRSFQAADPCSIGLRQSVRTASCSRCRRRSPAWASRAPIPSRSQPDSFRWRSRCPRYLHRLRKILAASRPALLHTNGLKAHIVGARAGEPSKIVWHMHEYIGARRVTRALLARHQRHVAAMIVNSKSVAADLAAALRPSAPVHVVYNAVDLDAFAPDGPAEDLDRRAGLAPAHGGVVRVGLVSTFARWKGHDVFLRAMASIPADLPVRGYIVGGPLYDTTGSQHSLEELQALADRLRLAGRVGFTGFLPRRRRCAPSISSSTRARVPSHSAWSSLKRWPVDAP